MLWLCSQCLFRYWFRERSKSVSARPSLREGQSSFLRGTFHSTQNSGNFGWYIKWNGPFRFGPTGIFGTSFKGGPLWLVWSFWSVGPKYPFPFDKIVVSRTALETRGGYVKLEYTVPWGTWNFRNFKPEFLLNGKRPRCYLKSLLRLLSFIQCSFK